MNGDGTRYCVYSSLRFCGVLWDPISYVHRSSGDCFVLSCDSLIYLTFLPIHYYHFVFILFVSVVFILIFLRLVWSVYVFALFIDIRLRFCMISHRFTSLDDIAHRSSSRFIRFRIVRIVRFHDWSFDLTIANCDLAVLLESGLSRVTLSLFLPWVYHWLTLPLYSYRLFGLKFWFGRSEWVMFDLPCTQYWYTRLHFTGSTGTTSSVPFYSIWLRYARWLSTGLSYYTSSLGETWWSSIPAGCWFQECIQYCKPISNYVKVTVQTWDETLMENLSLGLPSIHSIGNLQSRR